MRLYNGQHFPAMRVRTLEGADLKLPEDLGCDWAVLLFHRGGF